MDRHQYLVAASMGAAVAFIADRLICRLLPRKHARIPKADASNGLDAQPKPQVRRPPPHPDWQPGIEQPPPYGLPAHMHSIDCESTPSSLLYPLMISAIVPRPIGFLSTRGPNGEGNLAPYSYFNVVAHAPPHVVVGCCASASRDHGRKDTLFNILATKEFVVNIISEWYVEAANHCCGNFDYGDDEMQLSGLTPLPSVKVAPPRVAESAVQLECKLAHTYEVKDANGKVTTTIVIGRVLMVHVAEAVAGASPTGKLIVDVDKLFPISRLGGNTYGRSEGLFDLPRPDRST